MEAFSPHADPHRRAPPQAPLDPAGDFGPHDPQVDHPWKILPPEQIKTLYIITHSVQCLLQSRAVYNNGLDEARMSSRR